MASKGAWTPNGPSFQGNLAREQTDLRGTLVERKREGVMCSLTLSVTVWTMTHRATWRCRVLGCHCLPTAHCSCTSTGAGGLSKQARSTTWTGSAAPWRWAWARGGVVKVPHEG